MDIHEILEKGHWVKNNQFVVELENRFIKTKVPFAIDFNEADNERVLSPFTIKAINDFLNLDGNSWRWIKEELFKACQYAFVTTSYGVDGAPRKPLQSEFEANQDLFQIYSMDDAFAKSFLQSVSTGNNLPYCFFYMMFTVPWDNEHSVNFSFVEGQNPFVE